MFERFKTKQEDKDNGPFVPEGPYTPPGQEVSPERLERIKEEVTARLEKSGKAWVQVEMECIKVYTKKVQEDPERTAAYALMEPILEEVNAAKKRFWSKFRIAASVLWLAAAAPQDKQQEFGTNAYEDREAAAQQLEKNGVTDFQKQAYIPHLSEILSRGLLPFGYKGKNKTEEMMELYGAAVTGMFSEGNLEVEQKHKDQMAHSKSGDEYAANELALHQFQNRMDAWNLYLGLPQRHNTFSISDYKPENSKEDIYYYAIPTFLNDLHSVITKDLPYDDRKEVSTIQMMLTWIASEGEDGKSSVVIDEGSKIMGQFNLSKGEDEQGHYISYWDRWDLGGSIEGESGVVGKPYEIYDRIYYDPQTLEAIEPKVIKTDRVL